MWQHMFCVSVMRAVWMRELTHPHSTHHNLTCNLKTSAYVGTNKTYFLYGFVSISY